MEHNPWLSGLGKDEEKNIDGGDLEMPEFSVQTQRMIESSRNLMSQHEQTKNRIEAKKFGNPSGIVNKNTESSADFQNTHQEITPKSVTEAYYRYKDEVDDSREIGKIVFRKNSENKSGFEVGYWGESNTSSDGVLFYLFDPKSDEYSKVQNIMIRLDNYDKNGNYIGVVDSENDSQPRYQ